MSAFDSGTPRCLPPCTSRSPWGLARFGLAVGANGHSLSVESTSQHRQFLLLALAIWPIMTAIPAFLVALGVNVVLARVLKGARDRE